MRKEESKFRIFAQTIRANYQPIEDTFCVPHQGSILTMWMVSCVLRVYVVLICDMIKGNESDVADIVFEI